MAHGPSKVEIWMMMVSLVEKSLSSRDAIDEIIEEGVGVIALISSRFSDQCLFCCARVSKYGSIGVENTNAANLGSSANRWMTIVARQQQICKHRRGVCFTHSIEGS